MKHRQPIEWSRRQVYNRAAKVAAERLREIDRERKLTDQEFYDIAATAMREAEMAALEGDDVPDDMEAK